MTLIARRRGGRKGPREETGVANRKRVAVVIGSGSVKCAAAIELTHVLAREGIDVDLLVGCSAGAIFTR